MSTKFVIEAVVKAQAKFREANMENGMLTVPHFKNSVVLVADDANNAQEGKDKNIRTFNTHFIFPSVTEWA